MPKASVRIPDEVFLFVASYLSRSGEAQRSHDFFARFLLEKHGLISQLNEESEKLKKN